MDIKSRMIVKTYFHKYKKKSGNKKTCCAARGERHTGNGKRGMANGEWGFTD
jgi:hypothetical protein